MFPKRYSVSLLLIFILIMSVSCSNPKKHIELATELENSGSRIEANKELIQALYGTGNKKKKAELQVRIAANYALARRYSDAIEYYKQAIENYNIIRERAPYPEIAECYIRSGDINSAIALLSELDRVKPVDYLIHQATISKNLAANYKREKSIEKAQYYYKEYLGYAKKLNSPPLIEDAKNRLEQVEKKMQ